jgi:hypothetical protein
MDYLEVVRKFVVSSSKVDSSTSTLLYNYDKNDHLPPETTNQEGCYDINDLDDKRESGDRSYDINDLNDQSNTFGDKSYDINDINDKTKRPPVEVEQDDEEAAICRVIELDLGLPLGSLELWEPIRSTPPPASGR